MSLRPGRRDPIIGRRTSAPLGVLLLCLSLACATIESPGGGPPDETPPTVLRTKPDSAAVGLVGVDKLELVFSEKVDPRSAERFLNLYPDLEIRKTRWHSRRRVEVFLSEPLPPDTLIIVEIPPGFPDAHRVSTRRVWQMPIATADSLPTASIEGSLVHKEKPLADGVVELYAVPPDTLEWNQQKPLRRTAADSLGVFRFDWLPAGSGPYLLRAYQDKNRDFRAGDNEAQRLLPGQYVFAPGGDRLAVGLHILYAPNDPGRLEAVAETDRHLGGALMGWPMRITDADTGFVPEHGSRAPRGFATISAGDTTVWEPAGPGLVRLVLFADLDGDSLLSALPTDTLRVLAMAPDTTAVDTLAATTMIDSILWGWEPYALADSIEVEPGLPTLFSLPQLPDTLAVCAIAPPKPEPLPVATDSLAIAASDSLAAAAADTLKAPGVRE